MEWYSIAKDIILLLLGGFGTVVSAVAGYIIRQHNREYGELRSSIKAALEEIDQLQRNHELRKIELARLREDYTGLHGRHDSLSKRFGKAMDRAMQRIVRIETKQGFRIRDDDDSDPDTDVHVG